MINTSLGPYKIIEQLGAGGMGEVYLGEDTRLGRKVAIKVLPAEFASDPERLARFEQEARAAAALNHPHIAVVHDIGTEGDTHFMVQEYLEGQSLRELLRDTQPKLERTLTIAAEVADALATAHAAGIVHRDIKPDNIFITASGHTKVLDFGLAKLVEGGTFASRDDATMSPTAIGTMAGVAMGTVGYMAPEQVEAGNVDHRADIFALGCVLYEMACGRRPFEGGNVHTTLGRILSKDPKPIHTLRPELPARLEWIIDKCLAKDPARRAQTADDLAVDLRHLAEDVRTSSLPGPYGAARTPATLTGWQMILGVVVVLAATLFGVWISSAPQDVAAAGPVARFRADGDEERVLAQILGYGASILVDDGSHTVYYPARGPDRKLRYYRRRLDSLEPEPIDGSDVGDIVWARSLSTSRAELVIDAWAAEVGMRRYSVPVNGGTAREVSADDGFGGTAAPGSAYVPLGNPREVRRIGADGRGAETVFTLPEGSVFVGVAPGPIGDGRHLLVTVWREDGESSVQFLDLTEGDLDLRIPGSNPHFLGGYLIYGWDGAIYGQRFDVEALETIGPAIMLVDGVAQSTNPGWHPFTLSSGGTLAYVTASAPQTASRRMVWVDFQGQTTDAFEGVDNYNWPRLSPNGTEVAVGVNATGVDNEVWVLDSQTGATTIQATNFVGGAPNFAWSPDGTYLAYAGWRPGAAGRPDIFVKRVNGSADPEPLYGGPGWLFPMIWTEPGEIIYEELDEASRWDIRSISVEGEPMPTDVIVRPGIQDEPRLSPDGKWLSYRSNVGGTNEVYVQAYPGGIDTETHPVSVGGGSNARWSPSSDEIYYQQGNRMMAVSISTDGGFTAHRPRELFELERFGSFDADPNGERFLMALPVADPAPTPSASELIVVANWLAEVERIMAEQSR